jgi:DNA-binding SARP family transcriptional activator
LIYHQGQSFPKGDLFELLYDYDSDGDPSNTFRVTVHRIKKMLWQAGLPERPYITCKNGMCGWQNGVECIIDVRLFEKYINEADEPALPAGEKIRLYQKAIDLYKGEFLLGSETLNWVAIESARLKKLYCKCIEKAAELLNAENEYKTAFEIYSKASFIYPYDEEFHIGKISALINMKRYREALSNFENVTEMFFKELGLKPSDNLIRMYQKISEHIPDSQDDIDSIKEYLSDDVNGEGAYYCNYLTFVESYRFVMRIIERSGQSVYLMLCSLTDSSGKGLGEEKLTEASAALHKAIKYSLRRGDMYTRYSPNQFLVLLLGINLENCSLVSDRIAKRFRELYTGRGCRLRYKVIPAQKFNTETSIVKFKTGNIKW